MSSFISTFERIWGRVLAEWGPLSPSFWTGLAVSTAVLGIAWFICRRFRSPWRGPACLVIFILAMRLVLFDNSFSWGFYSWAVDKEVGWRQGGVIKQEARKYHSYPHPVKYLVVGSSQTDAVYRSYAADHDEMVMFSLAGMGPMDFYLYREYIASFRPETILLFISEFDLARQPPWDAVKLGPAQGLDFLDLYAKVSPMIDVWPAAEGFLKEFGAGELFPEYKYGFVFRAFVDRFLKKSKALKLTNVHDIEMGENREDRIAQLSKMDPAGLDFGFSFLADFAKYCDAQGLEVVIVEGQYNPLAYSAHNLELNRRVKAQLSGLADRLEHCRFIPRTELMNFTPDDFHDASHVLLPKGREFSRRLVQYLEKGRN